MHRVLVDDGEMDFLLLLLRLFFFRMLYLVEDTVYIFVLGSAATAVMVGAKGCTGRIITVACFPPSTEDSFLSYGHHPHSPKQKSPHVYTFTDACGPNDGVKLIEEKTRFSMVVVIAVLHITRNRLPVTLSSPG